MKFKDALKHSIKTLGSSDFIEEHRKEDPAMVKYFSLLADINREGFLTENSQAGKRTFGKHYQDGTPFVISERAYLAGYMEADKAVEFVKRMSIKTDKVVMFIAICGDTTHIPAALDIPVTITEKAGKTDITTHQSTALPESVDAIQRSRVKLNKNDSAVMLFCYDTHWNRNAAGPHGLFTEVLKILKSIQTKCIHPLHRSSPQPLPASSSVESHFISMSRDFVQ